MNEPDDTHIRDELFFDVLAADWSPVEHAYSTEGVRVTFAKGATTKEVFGKTDEDAYRTFLSELNEPPE